MGWAAQIDGKKTNNHPRALAGKIELRRKLLAAIPEPRVLDAFRGSGVIAGKVYHSVASYTPCDMVWHRDGKPQFVCDNKRLLRHLDLREFNLFDFDAYGSPWPLVEILAFRRPLTCGETIGLALTDGSSMKARLGRMERALASLSGVDIRTRGANRDWRNLTIMALRGTARRMNANLESVSIIDLSAKRSIVYSCAIFRGHGSPQDAIE